jgi:hypothetical protein
MIHQILLSDKIKEDEMGGSCSMHWMRDAYNILVEKQEGKRKLRSPRHRWENKY